MGLFAKIKQALAKTKDALSYRLNKLFTGGVLTDDFFDELESILLSADISYSTVEYILDQLEDTIDQKHIRKPEDVRVELKRIIVEIVDQNDPPELEFPLVVVIVGVNGVGKTTTIGKLAHHFRKQKRSVTIAAADTFRAAASSQLEVWADRAGVRIIKHAEGADPGAVVYDAVASVKSKSTDVLLVDTAGRLHNKKNLMDELGKIVKIINGQMPNAHLLKYIVLDATTGQNAISQVEAFDELIDIDGIILTKLDGTAKGGAVVSIVDRLSTPIVYIGTGETIDDLEEFDPHEFCDGLME